ncbi:MULTISPECIES: winged helix-turn-helix domain-containing protein [unclassified Pseudomonas]|uniref:winged helix-turn-helix domain-containing protein n=1 Tax=unclassified Pseudomonas TaxID=196821 RepID=UPI00186623C9|nr:MULTISPECIES: winged helix-turn-helix domain-containing protein [unclassified Pseudomonas]
MKLETWILIKKSKSLTNGELIIYLSKTELKLLEAIAQEPERKAKTDLLIRQIDKQPNTYKGLPMCISRLRNKFKNSTNGKRLFVAIRNYGYCTTQLIVVLE